MSAPDANMISVWRERWRNSAVFPYRASPFGMTENGAEDYRGAPFERQILGRLDLANVDFTGSNLEKLRVESCNFNNCIFDHSILTELITKDSSFRNCSFVKSDLRLARIGYAGTEFFRCKFDGVKLARAGFFNAIFTEINFKGKDWSHTDFGASGFWNCSFNGILNDIIFRGRYLLAYQYELSGAPKRTGLHKVDFSDSKLYWVAAYNGCSLEEITLPSDGSSFICRTRDLLQFITKIYVNSTELMLSKDIVK